MKNPKGIIETKLKEIASQKEQMVAQLNACAGAEQMLKELLRELEQGGDKDGEHNDSN